MSQDSATLVDGWTGPNRPYDLVREATIITIVVVLVVAAFALTFGAPRRDAVTFQAWAEADPVDLATTALTELDGTSGTAGYGPPYTSDGSASQSLLGVAPATFTGRTIPIDTADDLVLTPLRTLTGPGTPLAEAIDRFGAADTNQQQGWTQALATTLQTAQVGADGRLALPPADGNPVVTIVGELVGFAQDGAFTAATIDAQHDAQGVYLLDTTASSLFMSDGGYLSSLAGENGLSGDAWGAVNTLGHWPGQWWLVLFSLWYQFPPGTTAANADLIIGLIVAALSVVMLTLPWIPGLRSVPRRLRVARLVWRDDSID